MRRSLRLVIVVAAVTAIISLASIVVVSSRAFPGGDPPPTAGGPIAVHLESILHWTFVAIAVLGAVLMMIRFRDRVASTGGQRRSPVRVLASVVIFVTLFWLLAPLTRDFLADLGQADTEAAPGAETPSQGIGSAGWLLAVLLAAAIATALTKLGIAVRREEAPFLIEQDEMSEPIGAVSAFDRDVALALSSDTRSRVLAAYARFEQAADQTGSGRLPAETARAHARRLARERALDHDMVEAFVDVYDMARFSQGHLDDGTAAQAEDRGWAMWHALEEES